MCSNMSHINSMFSALEKHGRSNTNKWTRNMRTYSRLSNKETVIIIFIDNLCIIIIIILS